MVASPSSSVFVLGGGRGPVSFRGCEGGNVLSQLWSLVVVASPSSLSSSSCCLFLFLGGAGGQSASGCVCCFCGEWRRVSFRGWEMIMKGMGSESASGGAMEKGLMSSSFEGGHST